MDQAISADLLVTSTRSSSGLSTLAPPEVARIPGVTATNTVYRGEFEIHGTVETLTGTTTRHLAGTVILRMTAGRAAAVGRGELLAEFRARHTTDQQQRINALLLELIDALASLFATQQS